MDEELTLHELRRLEAERKLRTIPIQVLETAWVRDAQIEAVIDAVLAVTYADDAASYAHARHVGEWCARIAAALPYGPEPSFARCVGVLADIDPATLERIVELRHFVPYVRDYQKEVMECSESLRAMSIIVMVADEFDARLLPDDSGTAPSPTLVLRFMLATSDTALRPIVNALCEAVHFSQRVRVA